jgi:hypothetical protein
MSLLMKKSGHSFEKHDLPDRSIMMSGTFTFTPAQCYLVPKLNEP